MTVPVLAWIELGIVILLTVFVFVPMIRGFVSGAPFVPSAWGTARRMAELARLTPADRVIDPGCGDGRLLMACLDAGAGAAVGYELFLLPYLLARFYTRRYGSRCTVLWSDSRTRDFSGFTVAVCYMLPESMDRLKRQLRQLPPGARIISHAFAIPGWIHTHRDEASGTISGSAIYVYVRGQEGDET